MDDVDIETFILSECGSYAYENTVAISLNTARVVTLKQLKKYLRNCFPDEYYTVLDNFESLEWFLRTQGRDYMRSRSTRPWK